MRYVAVDRNNKILCRPKPTMLAVCEAMKKKRVSGWRIQTRKERK